MSENIQATGYEKRAVKNLFQMKQVAQNNILKTRQDFLKCCSFPYVDVLVLVNCSWF